MQGLPTAATDLLIDMAGGPTVLAEMIKAARFHARIVVTAAYAMPVPVDFQTMLLKELSLTMAIGYPTELPEVLETLHRAAPADIRALRNAAFPLQGFQHGL